MDDLSTTTDVYQHYFQNHPLRCDGRTGLENDARLAMYLIAFMRSYQDRTSGAWPDRDERGMLRNTCNSLEALHLLGAEAYTRDVLKDGAAWLIGLSTQRSSVNVVDDVVRSRWHPSRFKTLAWLRHFDTREVISDFEEINRRIDSDGYLRNVHPRRLLATLIYLDTLHHVQQFMSLPARWQQNQASALHAIRGEASAWAQDANTNEPFVSLQELSYTLDILLTCGSLDANDPVAGAMLDRLLHEFNDRDDSKLLRAETLYHAIQISHHFGTENRADRAIRHLRNLLRQSYQALNPLVIRQEFSFHPLVLRLLIAIHGEKLRDAILGQLFVSYEEQSRLQMQARQDQFDDELRHLLHEQVTINLLQSRALSGGMRSEKIYEVRFEVAIHAPGEQQEVTPFRSDQQRIVVKAAHYEDLIRAIDEYKNLPEAIRPLFATHAHQPYATKATPGATGYLIMQDLVEMRTLEDLLNSIDMPVLTSLQNQALEDTVSHVADALHQIHQEDALRQHAYASDQLARLYFAPIEKAILSLSRRHSGLEPEMRRLHYNGKRYPPFSHYHAILQREASRLRPSKLSFVHGDCHTRNIMLDQRLGRVKFIDLDHVNRMGDYIDDFALLLEDACVYRYLRLASRPDQATASERFAATVGADGLKSWRWSSSLYEGQLIQQFQNAMLRQLPAHARQMDDKTNWRPRLWLATAARLFRLAALVRDFHQALFLYAEAIRLLDTLCHSLSTRTPLPALLFTEASTSTTEPALDERVEILAGRLRTEWPDLSIQPRGSRLVISAADGRLLGLIFSEEQNWRLAAACLPSDLISVAPKARPFPSGPLQAVIDLPDDFNAAEDLANAYLHLLLS